MSSGLIFLTLARTFMRIIPSMVSYDTLLSLYNCPSSGLAIGDSSLSKIVRGQLDRYAVSGNDTDKMFPHLAGDVSYNSMSVL